VTGSDGRTDRKLEAAWLKRGPLPRVLDMLDRDGEEARVIGGAVRNTLLGLPAHEFDVATTALPEEVARRVEAAGFKAVPTGIEHGTITVVADKHPFEVTTLRRDVETYGRHAKVEFGRDWRGDAHRRDFTINAFSVTPDGALYDYVGGLADLDARRVRFIGDPRERIREDFLRILRFFRFHAAYGHNSPDAEGLAACIAARDGLDQLSRERVCMELMKLLVAAGAAPTLAVMADAGLLLRALGGVPYLAGFARMVEIEAATGDAPDAVRRLGALGVAISEDAERLWQKLRLTNAEHTRLSAMGENWHRMSPTAGEQSARAFIYRIKPQAFSDSALLAWARAGAPADDAAWRAFATLPQRWTPPVFPIKAANFIARGIAPGPALGAAMRAAEEAWIAADFPHTQCALDAIKDAAMTVAK
jgi:poly(A) polymerase